MSELRQGDTIPLVLDLFDGDETKYCNVVVRNPADTVLFGGPIILQHIGGGQYRNYSCIMPAVEFVTCQYKVFNDNVYSIPSSRHSNAQDIFSLDESVTKTASEITGVIESMSIQSDIITKDIDLVSVEIDTVDGNTTEPIDVESDFSIDLIDGEISNVQLQSSTSC